MISKVREFVRERTQVVAKRAEKLRKYPVKAARSAAAKSAERISSLKAPVRMIGRSGVKLTSVSGTAVQSLIELQSEIVTSALNDAAAQLERAARTENVRDLVREQADLLRGVRDRIVEDMNRAAAIVTHAGRGVREVAAETYGKVTKPTTKKAPASKGKRKARKSGARRTTA